MPTLKAIRRRIASIKSTQQITRAMKLVAAARLRRAQEALNASRPYSEALTRVADSVLMAERGRLGPRAGAAYNVLIVAIASDRGQCGAYNANMARFAEEKGREVVAAGHQPQFIAVGRKIVDHFRRSNAPMVDDRMNHPHLATMTLARELANRMLTAYQSGEAIEVGIVYSHFRSAISQQPLYEQLLPIPSPEKHEQAQEGQPDEPPDGQNKTGVSGSSSFYLIEPSRGQLIPVVLRAYIEASVFHALAEAEASEQGARMTAMDNATNNAGEMVESLTLQMNRARQQMITKELMDIVGGAEALRG